MLRGRHRQQGFADVLEMVMVDDSSGLNYRKFGKRLLDLALLAVAAPFILPLMVMLGLLVKRDGGQAFYVQERIGKNGFTFKMWKLRTMVPNADELLEAYLNENPDARREWDYKQKLSYDPRITAVGKFLRKTSLDELPQLFNVLKGEMSLVGPRPMMSNQETLYPGLAYYRLRPGLTGSWQVSDRNESSFAERARFDTEYFNNLTFAGDLKLIFRTFGAVLRCTGR